MKSPDRDAADELAAAATNALTVLRQVALKGKKVGPLYSAANTASWRLSTALDAFKAQASEPATLRRRVAELEAHKTAMPVSGDSMYCGKCNQWLADGRRLLWHHASGKYYCIGCDPGSPPARKELAEVTIKDCPTCGGIHYGSHECPYISAACAVCGDDTILACSDCGINSAGKQSIHVCKKTECRDAHEQARHSQALPPGRNEG